MQLGGSWENVREDHGEPRKKTIALGHNPKGKWEHSLDSGLFRGGRAQLCSFQGLRVGHSEMLPYKQCSLTTRGHFRCFLETELEHFRDGKDQHLHFTNEETQDQGGRMNGTN